MIASGVRFGASGPHGTAVPVIAQQLLSLQTHTPLTGIQDEMGAF